MILRLQRKWFIDNTTLGELLIDDTFFCYTLEDKVRNKKIKGITAIPYGEYGVTVDYSTRFKKSMPHVLDVPEFEGIRIHAGNTAEDTDGCIIVGFIKGNAVVGKSRAALEQLSDILDSAISRNEKITLEITKEDVCETGEQQRQGQYWQQ